MILSLHSQQNQDEKTLAQSLPSVKEAMQHPLPEIEVTLRPPAWSPSPLVLLTISVVSIVNHYRHSPPPLLVTTTNISEETLKISAHFHDNPIVEQMQLRRDARAVEDSIAHFERVILAKPDAIAEVSVCDLYARNGCYDEENAYSVWSSEGYVQLVPHIQLHRCYLNPMIGRSRGLGFFPWLGALLSKLTFSGSRNQCQPIRATISSVIIIFRSQLWLTQINNSLRSRKKCECSHWRIIITYRRYDRRR